MKKEKDSFFDTIKKMFSPKSEEVAFKKYEDYNSLVSNFKTRIDA